MSEESIRAIIAGFIFATFGLSLKFASMFHKECEKSGISSYEK